ncbi:MAG: hypothetical protein IKT06_02225 [Aeriscardovia sp.]|nr:hypothetical protein [Aeriscardovia sp.]
MSSLYMARESSHGKIKGNIVSFPDEIEATSQNVAKYCLGPNGMPHTTICFSDLTYEDGTIVKHYRRSDRYIQAGCLYLDIDGDQHTDNKEWKEWVRPLLSLDFKVIVYASNHFKAHALVLFSIPITNPEDYKNLCRILIQKIQPSYPAVDSAVKDTARFSFEGAHVDNPAEWVVENNAPLLDWKSELSASVPQKKSEKVTRLDIEELIRQTQEPSKRHEAAKKLAVYDVCNSSTLEEAAEAYVSQVKPNGDFTDKEAADIFNWAQEHVTLGKIANSVTYAGEAPAKRSKQQFAKDIFAACDFIIQKCREKFAILTPPEGTVDYDERYESGQIYQLFPTTAQDRGVALECDRCIFDRYVADLICDYEKTDPEVALRLKDKQKAYFRPDSLTSEKLVLRREYKCYFTTGIYDVDKQEFIHLKPGQFLTEALPFPYTEELPKEGGPIWNFLHKYLPRCNNEALPFSIELYILFDLFRSAMGGCTGDEQCLVEYGKGSNGKSSITTLWEAALGQKRCSKLDNSILVGKADRFVWLKARGLYMAHFDELPIDYMLSDDDTKGAISQDSHNMEVKGGKKWSQYTYFKPYMTTNRLPRFKDGSTYGFKRKIRCIEFRQVLHPNGRAFTPSEDLVEDARRLFCACLRLPQLPREVWEDYPLRQEWLETNSEAAEFADLLRPADADITIGRIRTVLKKANLPIAKKPYEYLAEKFREFGYDVKKMSKSMSGGVKTGGYVIHGAEINPDCALWEFVHDDKTEWSVHSNRGEIGPDTNSSEIWKKYLEEISPLLKVFPTPFDLSDSQNDDYAGENSFLPTPPNEADWPYSDPPISEVAQADIDSYYGIKTVQSQAVNAVLEEDNDAASRAPGEKPALKPFNFGTESGDGEAAEKLLMTV